MVYPQSEFQPDFPIEHPGAFLEWILNARGIKKVDFARRCGRPTKTISEIISGKASITPDTAIQFERVLGEGAAYWLGLEARFQLQQARSKDRRAIVAADTKSWVRNFPAKEMATAGFLSKGLKEEALIEGLLRFFGVSSVSAFEECWRDRLALAKFKQHDHHKINLHGVAGWLRQGEILAEDVTTQQYSEAEFRRSLSDIRSLTCRPWSSIELELIDTCASVGVALALVPSLPNTGMRGAAHWVTKDKAVITLSDHGKSEEKLWFAFYHEAAHILLHSKKAVFIDHSDDSGSADRELEAEANEFAAEQIIPRQEVRKFEAFFANRRGHVRKQVLVDFAASLGISPGLLLERLQFNEILDRNTKLNKELKRRVEFRAT